MRRYNQEGQCRACGARIKWIKTPAGKNMPVDPQVIYYKKVKGGKERIVLPTGQVVAAELHRPEFADGYGFRSHFSTCPNYSR